MCSVSTASLVSHFYTASVKKTKIHKQQNE